MSQRLEYMDVAKGIAILLVILGHHDLPPVLYDWIYSFHMPLFFIVSGYFWHKVSMVEELKKGLKNLLIPLWTTKLLWVVLLLIAYNYRGSYTGPDWKVWLLGGLFEKGDFRFAMGWFLAALFWGKLWMNILHPLSSFWKYLTIALIFIIPVYLRGEGCFQTDGTQFPCNFLQGMTSVLFLTIGHLLHDSDFFDKRHPMMEAIAISGLCFGFLMPLNMAITSYPLSYWNILASSLASIGLLFLCKYLAESSRLHGVTTALSFVGRNSLAILCIHALEYSVQPQRLLVPYFHPYLHGIIVAILIVLSLFVVKRIPVLRDIYKIKLTP